MIYHISNIHRIHVCMSYIPSDVCGAVHRLLRVVEEHLHVTDDVTGTFVEALPLPCADLIVSNTAPVNNNVDMEIKELILMKCVAGDTHLLVKIII